MFEIIRHIIRGQSLARILMNLSFRGMSLSGRVVDVGGARNPDYFKYFDVSGVGSIEPVDGSISGIDFEKDPLSSVVRQCDTVVICNVLEHIFNHRFLLEGIFGVLVPRGKIVGFVPFLVQYHPDPHDFFRYTQEALQKLLSQTGFIDVNIVTVGGGPFYVQYNTIMLSLPRFLRVPLFIPYFFLDKLFIWLRRQSKGRYPLGYTFYATKPD